MAGAKGMKETRATSGLEKRATSGFAPRSGRRARKAPSKGWLMIRETLMMVVVALAISAIIKAFLLQAFQIPSSSMEQTLQINDRIIVSKLVPKYRQLNRGDVIVFQDDENWLKRDANTPSPSIAGKIMIWVGLRPDDSHNHLVKRIVGLPGDRVQCCDTNGRLKVNGVSVDESGYINPGSAPSLIKFDVTVPAGKLWVMGDNRSNSEDSRFHMKEPSKGFVSVDQVTGRAFSIMWPITRVSTIKNTDAFAAVPPAP
ncbi:signal peptidase I [Varibaculum vaginae]|uniref:signal peptidase I n=1 Tax=Varibaculum vaginae TaxID=2364797 RepID=UPI001F181A7E|nr:signal peptidase I [Varibaculum vaginae]